MLKCEICETDGHYKLRCEHGIWICKNCTGKRQSTTESHNLHLKVSLYEMKNVSKARVDELDRRVILPYVVPGHDYIVGRRNDDGSVSDKPCDIRP